MTLGGYSIQLGFRGCGRVVHATDCKSVYKGSIPFSLSNLYNIGMIMRLRQLAANQTEVALPCGAVVFFSYETPVAAMLPSGQYIRTEQKYSVTTSKHLNKWLVSVADSVKLVPQDDLNRLAGE